MIFEAMAIEMSTASWRTFCSARDVSSCDLALGVLDDVLGVGARLLLHLLAGADGVGARARDDGIGLGPRLGEDARRFVVQALQLLPRLPRFIERLADRFLPAIERVEQRAPRELGEQPSEHDET